MANYLLAIYVDEAAAAQAEGDVVSAPYREFMQRVFATRGTGWRLRPVLANGRPRAAPSLASTLPRDVAARCRDRGTEPSPPSSSAGTAPACEIDGAIALGRIVHHHEELRPVAGLVTAALAAHGREF